MPRPSGEYKDAAKTARKEAKQIVGIGRRSQEAGLRDLGGIFRDFGTQSYLHVNRLLWNTTGVNPETDEPYEGFGKQQELEAIRDLNQFLGNVIEQIYFAEQRGISPRGIEKKQELGFVQFLLRKK